MKKILYIYYPIYFQKNSNNVEGLIYFNNKINVITSIYTLNKAFKSEKMMLEINKLITQVWQFIKQL